MFVCEGGWVGVRASVSAVSVYVPTISCTSTTTERHTLLYGATKQHLTFADSQILHFIYIYPSKVGQEASETQNLQISSFGASSSVK